MAIKMKRKQQINIILNTKKVSSRHSFMKTEQNVFLMLCCPLML